MSDDGQERALQNTIWGQSRVKCTVDVWMLFIYNNHKVLGYFICSAARQQKECIVVLSSCWGDRYGQNAAAPSRHKGIVPMHVCTECHRMSPCQMDQQERAVGYMWWQSPHTISQWGKRGSFRWSLYICYTYVTPHMKVFHLPPTEIFDVNWKQICIYTFEFWCISPCRQISGCYPTAVP